MSVVNRVVSIPLPLAQSAGGGRGSSDEGPVYREAPFLAGPENYLAATAVTSFFEPAGNGDPPLVFYGPAGVGKTHLVLGLAAGSRRYYPQRAVAYATGAEFARDVNDAIARKTTVELRRKYRQLDLLVLDGVDALANKPSAQGELLHTLDALHNRAGRVVVATRQAPAEMLKLFPALRGRLSQGLVVPVAAPGPEARLELVVQLAAARRIEISRRAARALAAGLPVTAPRLMSALGDLHAAARERGRPIDVAAVRRLTKERASAGGLTLRGIAAAVCRHYGLRLAELRGPSRRQSVVVARGVAVYLARRLTNSSLEQIGRFFGERDHTTMLHAFRRVEQLLETDPGIRQSLGELQANLEVG
jgi:chromosomal replication initiator protein